MPQVTIDEALEIAIRHHQAGRLPEAETIYRQVLAQHSRHPRALHLLGVIACQSGRHEMAAELIGKAIEILPSEAAFHSNLGEALRLLGRLDMAANACSRAIELQPDLGNASNN